PGGQLEVHLTASAGGKPIHIDGILGNLTPAPVDSYGPRQELDDLPTGQLVIHGQQIAISTALIDALEEDEAEVIRELDPQGLFSFRWAYERPSLDLPDTTSTDLEFHDCQIRF